jgi:(hydroxyamino)benzene mutase
MSESLQDLLCRLGVLLFLLGLLGGAAIPRMRSPRIGLSAHIAAIESGILLIALGLLGARLTLSDGMAALIAHLSWISLYVLWVGLMLGGVWGTGRTLPIAGAGVTATQGQERTAAVLILGGSLGSAAGALVLLIEWSWRTV